ncbi:EpsI family protein [Bremerella cremea]|uniref:EpsI family protein n=1 Tax=Blastopirellula marina TaxID=124 RepID=A0A2S8FKZ3_9BACT|nr:MULTISPECIES: exosortase C-terminal domain/associated protein EpsI [Pirellulaceae]PQO32836.1 EpsI family protein [Blastopirellula marina]RCS45903.1 EpsI family protein [Bremerella cremea]
MNKIAARTIVVCTFVLLCSAGATWLEHRFDVTVRQPDVDVNKMPEVFAGWESESVPIDPEIARFVGAGAFVSRVYRRSGESPVSVYAAVWADQSIVSDISPHPPTVCYPNAGWTQGRSKEVLVGGALPVLLLEFSRAGERIVTAHWYQLGGLQYTDRDSGRFGLSKLWGEQDWPPMVKVLLQTQASSIEDAESQLIAIASEVNEFTKTIQ